MAVMYVGRTQHCGCMPVLYMALIAVFMIQIVYAEKAHLYTKPAGSRIKDQYIVALKPGVDMDLFIEGFPGLRGLMRHRFTTLVNGFSGEIPPGILKKLLDSDDVDFVEEDAVETASYSWSIDRMDQRDLPLDQLTVTKATRYLGCFVDGNPRLLPDARVDTEDMTLTQCFFFCAFYGFTYAGLEYSKECHCGSAGTDLSDGPRPDSECNKKCNGDDSQFCGGTWRLSIHDITKGGGSGVHIYIVDSGVRGSHDEFSGRFGNGHDVYGLLANGEEDCDGHGTHCAGIAAGATMGLAPEATIHSVKVLKCEGGETTASSSKVAEGMEWVLDNHQAPAVLSISVGSEGYSNIQAIAVNTLHTAGVVVVASAGNDNFDACRKSPGGTGYSTVITVAATDQTDNKPTWSNFGTCVDIFAGGDDIISAGTASDSAEKTMSGTSMAAPLVAGAAAILLDRDGTMTPTQVADKLVELSTKNKVTNKGTGSPNRLLYLTYGM